jgi:hypothetical protein
MSRQIAGITMVVLIVLITASDSGGLMFAAGILTGGMIAATVMWLDGVTTREDAYNAGYQRAVEHCDSDRNPLLRRLPTDTTTDATEVEAAERPYKTGDAILHTPPGWENS